MWHKKNQEIERNILEIWGIDWWFVRQRDAIYKKLS